MNNFRYENLSDGVKSVEKQFEEFNPDLFFNVAPYPLGINTQKVAIIGAGISGLICARTLHNLGFSVTVFDKSRAPGGRISTRKIDPNLAFDHGAQYFTARHPLFSRFVNDWQNLNIVAPWGGRIIKLQDFIATDTQLQQRFVGVPKMSSLASYLSQGLNIHLDTKIMQVCRKNSGWELTDEKANFFQPFNFLVNTLPGPQSAELLSKFPIGLNISQALMAPCWAVLVAFETPYEVPWDGAFIHNSPLSWVSRDSSKPGRNTQYDSWVLHGNPDWSNLHLEDNPQIVATNLCKAFSEATRIDLPKVYFRTSHRWRYSMGHLPQLHNCFIDPKIGLLACGDWLNGGRIEGAFLSGAYAAQAIFQLVKNLI